MSTSRIAKFAPIAAAALTMLTFVALPTAGYADGNSCTVPAGKTYDFLSHVNNSPCSLAGYYWTYHVITPATGVWACTIPAGFHQTASTSTDDCSGKPDKAAPMYQLAAN